ncbi:Nucleoporin Nup43 [Blattella germanica]|nr:Nucleoporin Nup43 [Blattella germanica]
MEAKVHGTFVSEKINKVRWKPEYLIESESFVTGSWDNETNQLVYWLYTTQEEDDPDMYPCQAASLPHEGDVTELKFINDNAFVAASSLGFVKLYKLDVNAPSIRETMSWDNAHFFEFGAVSSCTGLACFEEDIATVGEDGRLILLTARRKQPVTRIERADSCSLRCVCFLKHNEVLTGNLRGQMKVWDVKSSVDKPVSNFMLSGEQVGASCVTHHPTQRHLVLAGGEDGSLTVWDLRHNTFPVTLLSAHSDTVAELQFHPERPEHVFTCSTSGEVWHWDTSSMSRTDENPWLSTDASKHRLEVFTLMPPLHKPVNSLDINKNKVVCGCDNEAVYVFKNVML